MSSVRLFVCEECVELISERCCSMNLWSARLLLALSLNASDRAEQTQSLYASPIFHTQGRLSSPKNPSASQLRQYGKKKLAGRSDKFASGTQATTLAVAQSHSEGKGRLCSTASTARPTTHIFPTPRNIRPSLSGTVSNSRMVRSRILRSLSLLPICARTRLNWRWDPIA